MKKNVLKSLIEVAICAAISYILDLLQSLMFGSIFVSGGSIGIAMLPIVVIAYRRGFGYGILCGLIVSCVQLIGEPIYIINGSDYTANAFLATIAPFAQVMLDYFLAYTLVGFAGIFKKSFNTSQTKLKRSLYVGLGCVLGGMLKYLAHVISGGLFWLNFGSSFWGVDDTTWWYSFIYNGAYSIPNIILTSIFMIIFACFYPQILNLNNENNENAD